MTKKLTPASIKTHSGGTPLDVSGPIRPTHGNPKPPAYGRAIHGVNPSVKTVERKLAPKHRSK